MTNIEQQAVSIIREWTSITREHAALLAMKLNKAGLLAPLEVDADSAARFEAWQKNQEVKNGRTNNNYITRDEHLERIKNYCQKHYGTSGEELEIKTAWEGEYRVGGGMGMEGIFVTWENVANEFGGHYTQFLDVTVDELMRGDE